MKNYLSKKNLALTLLVALLYFTLSIYLINYQMVLYTITNSTSLMDKVTLLYSLSKGSLQILPSYEILLITLTALLVGINTACLISLIKRMKDQGKIRLTTGGTSLLALVGIGCPNCGISILSVLGISSSVLPIHGTLLQVLTLLLLIASLFYNIRKLRQPIVCRVKESTK